MSIDDEIKSLGIRSSSNGPILPSESDIAAAQKTYGRELPSDYLALIQKYGRCTTRKLCSVVFPEPIPLYVDDRPDALPVAPLDGAGFSFFYGGNRSDGTGGLADEAGAFGGRMPNGLLPIGGDLFGNKFCLGYSPNGEPGVYFWDHEFEWDADDYQAETGKRMPEIVKYQNIYFIANTFREFLEMMEEDEEND